MKTHHSILESWKVAKGLWMCNRFVTKSPKKIMLMSSELTDLQIHPISKQYLLYFPTRRGNPKHPESLCQLPFVAIWYWKSTTQKDLTALIHTLWLTSHLSCASKISSRKTPDCVRSSVPATSTTSSIISTTSVKICITTSCH